MNYKGFVVAGTNSGCGKTTITLALMAWLIRKGYPVAPFKVGPDFIDPGHHTRITRTVSRNLDGWMLSRERNLGCFEEHAAGKVAVVEGVMGLFDGYDGKTEAGSTAQMAKWIDRPVILVVNARSMARSAAALVQGFERFDPDLRFAGVIFNQLGSPRHLAYLEEALEGNVNMPCLGGIPRQDDIQMPERHLGLVTSDDHVLSDESIERLADLIEEHIHVDKLKDYLPFSGRQNAAGPKTDIPSAASSNAKTVRIGIARDKAFCFYYQDNLDMLAADGAELVYFSPLEASGLPENLDGIYLGGGYPELFAEQLAANTSLRSELHAASRDGMPIYGECGGFMYLGTAVKDKNGAIWPMSGCLPFRTRMLPRLKALGYREIQLGKDTIIGNEGQTARGHEFHYSEIDNPEILPTRETVYRVTPRKGMREITEGFVTQRTLGSYIHLHFGSCPEISKTFISACLDYRQQRNRNHETQ